MPHVIAKASQIWDKGTLSWNAFDVGQTLRQIFKKNAMLPKTLDVIFFRYNRTKE